MSNLFHFEHFSSIMSQSTGFNLVFCFSQHHEDNLTQGHVRVVAETLSVANMPLKGTNNR